jgi:hypothetical protein
MAGQKTISTTYKPPPTPPTPPHIPYPIVSGSITPDATGEYHEIDYFGGKPRYRLGITSYILYWDVVVSCWFLTDHPGEEELGAWFKTDPEITGDYEPADPYEGTATVSTGYT